MRFDFTQLLALLILIATMPTAMAQSSSSDVLAVDQLQYDDAMPDKSSDQYIAMYLASVPKYQGSNENRTVITVGTHYEFSTGVYTAIDTWRAYDTFQIGKHFSTLQNLDFGVLTGAGATRGSFISDSNGSHNQDFMPFIGGFLRVVPTEDVQLNSELLYYFGQYRGGAYANFNAIKSFALAEHQTLSFSVGTELGNHDFVQSQYGISPTESLEFGYPEYQPKAGAVDLHTSVDWQWQLSSAWMLNSSIYATRLTEQVSATPQVQKKTNESFYVGIAYRF